MLAAMLLIMLLVPPASKCSFRASKAIKTPDEAACKRYHYVE
jgi:hypothetical protein